MMTALEQFVLLQVDINQTSVVNSTHDLQEVCPSHRRGLPGARGSGQGLIAPSSRPGSNEGSSI